MRWRERQGLKGLKSREEEGGGETKRLKGPGSEEAKEEKLIFKNEHKEIILYPNNFNSFLKM